MIGCDAGCVVHDCGGAAGCLVVGAGSDGAQPQSARFPGASIQGGQTGGVEIEALGGCLGASLGR
jgi:hypothetical protein